MVSVSGTNSIKCLIIRSVFLKLIFFMYSFFDTMSNRNFYNLCAPTYWRYFLEESGRFQSYHVLKVVECSAVHVSRQNISTFCAILDANLNASLMWHYYNFGQFGARWLSSSNIRHKDFLRPLSFSSVRLVLPPPEIWNGLDWRALVESCPPNIGKLRG